MPEPPHIKVKRFMEQYGLAEEPAKVLTSELELADTFEEVVKDVDAQFAALWMRDELKRVLYYNKLSFADSQITSQQLVELLKMVQKKELTTKAGQRVIENMPNNSKSPKEIAKEMGLIGIVNEDDVRKAAQQAIEENPEAVSDYHEGKSAALNFLVGQVMRLTRGKAEPGRAVEILKEIL
jgi:aspartyl-tRNA(Asn)/glutamyl-tRNA(Gln) amidotransferase subunit B